MVKTLKIWIFLTCIGLSFELKSSWLNTSQGSEKKRLALSWRNSSFTQCFLTVKGRSWRRRGRFLKIAVFMQFTNIVLIPRCRRKKAMIAECVSGWRSHWMQTSCYQVFTIFRDFKLQIVINAIFPFCFTHFKVCKWLMLIERFLFNIVKLKKLTFHAHSLRKDQLKRESTHTTTWIKRSSWINLNCLLID